MHRPKRLRIGGRARAQTPSPPEPTPAPAPEATHEPTPAPAPAPAPAPDQDAEHAVPRRMTDVMLEDFEPAGMRMGAGGVAWSWGDGDKDMNGGGGAGTGGTESAPQYSRELGVVQRPWHETQYTAADPDFGAVVKDLEEQQRAEDDMLADPGWQFMMQVAGLSHTQLDHLGRYRASANPDWPHLATAAGAGADAEPPEPPDRSMDGSSMQALFVRRVVSVIRQLRKENRTKLRVCVHAASGTEVVAEPDSCISTGVLPAREGADWATRLRVAYLSSSYGTAGKEWPHYASGGTRGPMVGGEWGTLPDGGVKESGWVTYPWLSVTRTGAPAWQIKEKSVGTTLSPIVPAMGLRISDRTNHDSFHEVGTERIDGVLQRGFWQQAGVGDKIIIQNSEDTFWSELRQLRPSVTCHAKQREFDIDLDFYNLRDLLLAAYAGSFVKSGVTEFGELLEPRPDGVRVARVCNASPAEVGSTVSNVANAHFAKLHSLLRFYTPHAARVAWIHATAPLASRIDGARLALATDSALSWAADTIAVQRRTTASNVNAHMSDRVVAPTSDLVVMGLVSTGMAPDTAVAARSALNVLSGLVKSQWSILNSSIDGAWISPEEVDAKFVYRPTIADALASPALTHLNATDRARAQVSAFVSVHEYRSNKRPRVPNPARENTVYPRAQDAFVGVSEIIKYATWLERIQEEAGGGRASGDGKYTLAAAQEMAQKNIRYVETPVSPFEPIDSARGTSNDEIEARMRARGDELLEHMASGDGGALIAELEDALRAERRALQRHAGMVLRARETAATQRVVFEPLMLGALNAAFANARSVDARTFKTTNFEDLMRADDDTRALFARLVAAHINVARHGAGRSYMHLGLSASYADTMRSCAVALRRVRREAGVLVMGPAAPRRSGWSARGYV